MYYFPNPTPPIPTPHPTHKQMRERTRMLQLEQLEQKLTLATDLPLSATPQQSHLPHSTFPWLVLQHIHLLHLPHPPRPTQPKLTQVPQPWSSPILLNATRRATRLHVAMRDYKQHLLQTDGVLVHHTLHCCPTSYVPSSRFDALSSQLLLGTDVLIAPILKRGGTTATVLVPPQARSK